MTSCIRRLFKCLHCNVDLNAKAQRSKEFNSWERWFFSYFEARIKMKEKGLDTCPKCKFNPNKTPSSIGCDECGLVGQCPWGG